MDKNDYPVITISGAEWQAALENEESAQHSLQQLKAEIRAMCIELECTSHDKFDCGMYHALRGRLRELSVI
jgi:hypothetical protein